MQSPVEAAERARRLGERISTAVADIYNESDPATVVALGVVGLKALTAALQDVLDAAERETVSRLCGSARDRADAFAALNAASLGGRRESGASLLSVEPSARFSLGSVTDARNSLGSVTDQGRRDSLESICDSDASDASTLSTLQRRLSGSSGRVIAVRSPSPPRSVETAPLLAPAPGSPPGARTASFREREDRRVSVGRSVIAMASRNTKMEITDEDRILLNIFDRMCASDERFQMETISDPKTGSSLDPQLTIERRIRIAERSAATGMPDGHEPAPERGRRMSLGFSRVIADQRALERIPRLDTKSKASARRAVVVDEDAPLAERVYRRWMSVSLIIPHDSKGLQIWEAVVMILVFYVVFMVPLMIGFRWEPAGQRVKMFWAGLFIDIFFLIDVTVNFNTSYLNEATKEEVADRWRIALRYCRGWFLIDFLSSIPVGDGDTGLKLVKALRMLKLARMSRLFRRAPASEKNVFRSTNGRPPSRSHRFGRLPWGTECARGTRARVARVDFENELVSSDA